MRIHFTTTLPPPPTHTQIVNSGVCLRQKQRDSLMVWQGKVLMILSVVHASYPIVPGVGQAVFSLRVFCCRLLCHLQLLPKRLCSFPWINKLILHPCGISSRSTDLGDNRSHEAPRSLPYTSLPSANCGVPYSHLGGKLPLLSTIYFYTIISELYQDNGRKSGPEKN